MLLSCYYMYTRPYVMLLLLRLYTSGEAPLQVSSSKAAIPRHCPSGDTCELQLLPAFSASLRAAEDDVTDILMDVLTICIYATTSEDMLLADYQLGDGAPNKAVYTEQRVFLQLETETAP